MTCQTFLKSETDRSQAHRSGICCACCRTVHVPEERAQRKEEGLGGTVGTPACRCDTTTYIRWAFTVAGGRIEEESARGRGHDVQPGRHNLSYTPRANTQASLLLVPRSLPLGSSPASGGRRGVYVPRYVCTAGKAQKLWRKEEGLGIKRGFSGLGDCVPR